jgi:hypothetical protein
MSLGATYRWSQMGLEQKLGFQAGRFTAVNLALTSILGGVFALFFYAGVWVVHRTFPVLTPLSDAFLRSQNLWTVIPMVALFFWSVAFLFLKTMKLRLQKKAMA